MTTALHTWMLAATTEQQDDLAERAGTSRPYLYKLASENPSFSRQASPALAAKIEDATLAMKKETRGKLPAVYRTDLNADCRACKFAQQCLGAKAVASQFEIIDEESGDAS